MLPVRSLPPGDLRVRSGRDGLSSKPQKVGRKATSLNSCRKGSASSEPSRRQTQTIRAIDVIRKKRDGQELSPAEIEYLVRAYTSGEIPDYQVSAWLMAVILRGLTRAETSVLTDAMLHSGDVLDLSEFAAMKVDKHSTGGVGDKTSLVLGAAGGGGRTGRSHDQRPRPRTYRRHAGQAGIHSRLQRQPVRFPSFAAFSEPAAAP